jgi:hypothetical protein
MVMHIGLYVVQEVYLKTLHWLVSLILMISWNGWPDGNAYWTLHSSRGLPQDTSLAGWFDTEDIMQWLAQW